jgi:hypothetical protein
MVSREMLDEGRAEAPCAPKAIVLLGSALTDSCFLAVENVIVA